MEISPAPPFEVSQEPDGTQHAVRDNIQVTILPDVGECKVSHRVGQKIEAGKSTRWLHLDLVERGIHVFIHGTHVVVSEKDLNPNFDLQSKEQLLVDAFKYLRVEKDEKGRYVIDTENNRRVVGRLLDLVTDRERDRIWNWVRYTAGKVMDTIK